MNYSSEDYLNQLDVDKENLVNFMQEANVVCDNTETFTELAPKIKERIESIVPTTVTTDSQYALLEYVKPSNWPKEMPAIEIPASATNLNLLYEGSYYGDGPTYKGLLPNVTSIPNGFTSSRYCYFLVDPSVGVVTPKISQLQLPNCTNFKYLFSAFSCYDLQHRYGYIDLCIDNLDLSNAVYFTDSFSYVSAKKIYLTQYKSTPNLISLANLFYRSTLVSRVSNELAGTDVLRFLDTSHVTDFSGCFKYYRTPSSMSEQMEHILTGVDTSSAINMSSMFENCYLRRIDLSSFDFSNVTNVASMFKNCFIDNNGNTDADVILPNTMDFSNVINMSSFLYRATGGLFSFTDTERWVQRIVALIQNTANVTDLSYCFYGRKMQSLDLTHWTAPKVTNMSYMFNQCAYLTSVKMPNISITDTCNCENMFMYINNYDFLDIRGLEFSKITNLNTMFSNFSSVKNNLQIIVKDNTEQTALETAYPLFIGHIITAADYEATQGGV